MRSNNGVPSTPSDTRRDLLRSAVRNGYFKVPREISTVELAEKNDMSSQEISEELHLALNAVLCDTELRE